MLLEVDHPQYGPITVCRSPIRLRGVSAPEYRVSPAYACDNEAVFAELGVDAAGLQRLRAAGAI